MARTTISISDDLKQRMSQVEGDVNWSQVASRAFEVRLAEIATKQKVKDMNDVVQRLRASKLQGEDEVYREGEEIGREWAKNAATWQQLERVPGPDHEMFRSTLIGSLFVWIAKEIVGDDDTDFWADVCGRESDARLDDEGFVRGFVDGANEIYDQVAQQI